MKNKAFLVFTFLLFSFFVSAQNTQDKNSAVKAWEENTVIPTYLTGPPVTDPMFYLGRAYQGAEGRVYPYPLYDKLTGKKEDKTYNMVYLENEYIKIGILPEIGGRLFSATDKTNNYHFFYTQHVIKPALIGMLGAWISGGVEWNIPHHHRATSFLPVQHSIEEHADGSKTIWVGELELRGRTRWAVGYTLRPGKSYLETSIRIFNRTPFANSILCFANAAVHANENYQVIFPPSTQYVTHHSKVDFTTWPIATTTYGGSDFTKGVDVSMYKNHILASSMFAWNYDDDFVGGYDHGKQAGTLCVADHHIVPGKKFWTWGNGPGGKLWDKTLTDDDGPYLELMVGAYSDNQPDYSWMEPYEAKIFDEFWFPIRDIGGVKKATKEAAMNLELKNGFAELGFNTTSSIANAMAMLKVKDKILLEEKISISPDKPYKKTIKLPAGTKAEDLHGALLLNNKEIIGYTPLTLKKEPFPEKVKPPLAPKEIKTNEELYLTGLRIQQFHNPSLSPEPYWQEALQRDSGDVKVNTAMGMLLLKKALYPEAEKYLRKAVERLTAKYTSPKDGEPYYYLGLALQQQGKFDDAYNAFYKATWNNEWKSAGYYALAEIDCQKGDFSKALDHINSSLMNNLQNTEALGLKATILRHLELHSEFSQVLQYLVSIDPLDTRALAENMLNGNQSTNQLYNETFNSFPENGLEQAIEYGNAGLWNDGLSLLKKLLDISPDKDKVSPMLYYYLGYFSEKSGQPEKSSVYYQLASTMPVDYVFPFQYENIDVLKQAIKADPKDARAPFYLGNLLYDWQPKEAIKYWELSVAIDSSFSMVHRNLAVGYANCENNTEKAILSLEKAITLPDVHAIHFFELDQLYETAGVSPEKRLAVLEKNHDMVNQRDDALSREIALKIFVGKYEEAIGYMQNRHFNVWEGGARFSVNDYWTDAHVLLGNKYMSQKQYQQALAEFQLAIEFPANLQTAKNRWSGRDPEVNYHIGEAYQLLGDKKQAEKYWKESSADIPAMGNDDVLPTTDQSILLYYKALSLKKLGNNEKANKIFNELVKSGQNALKKTSDVNFFAKFGQQKSERSRTTMAHYIIGLGYVGLSQIENAKLELTEALKESPDHLGTITALQELK